MAAYIKKFGQIRNQFPRHLIIYNLESFYISDSPLDMDAGYADLSTSENFLRCKLGLPPQTCRDVERNTCNILM
jgi:hypothetical protein